MKMKSIDNTIFFEELRRVLTASVGSDYAYNIASDTEFFDAVKQNVEETSAWTDEGYYNDDDIRLAIGRVIVEKLDLEY